MHTWLGGAQQAFSILERLLMLSKSSLANAVEIPD
jgi:hypothetical protein